MANALDDGPLGLLGQADQETAPVSGGLAELDLVLSAAARRAIDDHVRLLLAWNEYLYAFLLLSKDTDITLPVALGNFLAADDSPWELLMTTGFISESCSPSSFGRFEKRYVPLFAARSQT